MSTFGEGHVKPPAAIVFSADDGCDVGMDSGSPASPDMPRGGNAFNLGGSRTCSSRSEGRRCCGPSGRPGHAIASRWRARAAQSGRGKYGTTLSHMEVGVQDLRNRTSQVVDAVKPGCHCLTVHEGADSPISCRIGAASLAVRGASAR